jgi:hypothetical protein
MVCPSCRFLGDLLARLLDTLDKPDDAVGRHLEQRLEVVQRVAIEVNGDGGKVSDHQQPHPWPQFDARIRVVSRLGDWPQTFAIAHVFLGRRPAHQD